MVSYRNHRKTWLLRANEIASRENARSNESEGESGDKSEDKSGKPSLAEPGDQPLASATAATDPETEGQSQVRSRLARRQVTWADELPPDNLITAGNWWGADASAGYVSIEDDYAAWLNIEIGDTVEFEINQQTVTAQVSSFRSVRWDNMQPNFFIIFSPGTIDHLGATFLSTVLMESEQKILLNGLIRLFPTVVILEIDGLIEQNTKYYCAGDFGY